MISKLFRSLLSIALVASFLSQDSYASSRGPAAVSAESIERQEQQLIEEIDRQADVVFDRLKREAPELPVGLLQKTQREAVYRLKQMHVLTDVLKAAGPTPALALVAGEILSTFVFAPMFAAKGNVLMATVSMTVPWGVVAGGAAASLEMLKHRLRLARELNSSLLAMHRADKIRKVVIGYDVKHRISSLMLESMNQSLDKEIEFEVLKKMRNADAARTSFVTIAEVETLVKSVPEGKLFIEQIYFERLDRELFTALMIRFLNEHDELSERLLEVLKAREPIATTETPSLRRHLLAIDDMKKLVARDLKTIQHEMKETKRKAKAGELDFYQAEWVKKYLKEEITRLQGARGEIVRHEYSLLLELKPAYHAKDFVTVETIAKSYEPSLRSLRDSSRHVAPELAVARQRAAMRTPVVAPMRPTRASLCSNIFGAIAR